MPRDNASPGAGIHWTRPFARSTSGMKSETVVGSVGVIPNLIA
jgi:hypothetical protein